MGLPGLFVLLLPRPRWVMIMASGLFVLLLPRPRWVMMMAPARQTHRSVRRPLFCLKMWVPHLVEPSKVHLESLISVAQVLQEPSFI